MKIFPIKNYTFRLINESSETIAELEKNTLITESLTSQYTNKAFIGKISGNKFRVITSKPKSGVFCVLEGKLENKTGTIEITIHKTFQVLLILIFMFPIIGFIISLFTQETRLSISLIIPTLMSVLIFRFVFLELAFRIISNNGLTKLCEIIQITDLKRTVQSKKRLS